MAFPSTKLLLISTIFCLHTLSSILAADPIYLSEGSPQKVKEINCKSKSQIFRTREDPDKYGISLSLQQFSCSKNTPGAEPYLEIRNSENAINLTTWTCNNRSPGIDKYAAIEAITGSTWFNVSRGVDFTQNSASCWTAQVVGTLYQKISNKEQCAKGYFDCEATENGNRRCIDKNLRCNRRPSCGVVGRNLDEVNCRYDDDDSDEDNDDSHEVGDGDDDDDDHDDDDHDVNKILPYALPTGIFLITLLILVVCWRRWKQHKILKVGNDHVIIQSTAPTDKELEAGGHKEFVQVISGAHGNDQFEINADLPPSYGECVSR